MASRPALSMRSLLSERLSRSCPPAILKLQLESEPLGELVQRHSAGLTPELPI